jgi:ABC-type transporter Mla subunit MlaD
MRRAATLALAALTGAALLAGCGGGGSGSQYRVDAIFDNAGFLTPNVDVRVGGAKVGEVIDLKLTRDHKALVQMKVDKKFAPFRSDADCTIQSQSLISEKFIDCAPGTPNAKALTAPPGQTPTLGVSGTHSPVDIDLLLNIFRRPVRERLSLLLGALGTSLTGRGEDLNQTILRAAPALQQTRRMLAVFDADRAQLKQLIGDSDTVLNSLGKGSKDVAAFVRQAGGAAVISGQRRQNLAAAVHRLPALLKEARPSLNQLASFARVGTPFVDRLHAAAPGLSDLTSALGPFSKQVAPTLTRLATTARRTIPALTDIAPQIRRLGRFAAAAKPAGKLLAELLANSRDRGVPEGIGNLGYYGATAIARFDKFSHILPAYIMGSICAVYATSPSPGCNANYPASKTQRAAFYRNQQAKQDAKAKDKTPAKQPAPKPKLPLPTLKPATPTTTTPSQPVVPVPKVLQDVLDGVGALLDPNKAKAPPKAQGSSDNPVKDILDYLLK